MTFYVFFSKDVNHVSAHSKNSPGVENKLCHKNIQELYQSNPLYHDPDDPLLRDYKSTNHRGNDSASFDPRLSHGEMLGGKVQGWVAVQHVQRKFPVLALGGP